jgi:hypothetical protein
VTKKACFLAAIPWKRDPFIFIPPTPLQGLMIEVSTVPGILEFLDSSLFLTGNPGDHHLEEALSGLVEAVCSPSFANLKGIPEPFLRHTSSLGDTESLWYSDISAANYWMHVWAFWVICVTRIRQLRDKHFWLKEKDIYICGHSPESPYISEKVESFSISILRSMHFLMQNDMKLLGVVSAILPFRVVHEYFSSGGSGVPGRETYSQVAKEIISRGYQDILLTGVT